MSSAGVHMYFCSDHFSS